LLFFAAAALSWLLVVRWYKMLLLFLFLFLFRTVPNLCLIPPAWF
jgi:hypothetical protein